jgi:hypothetical protein
MMKFFRENVRWIMIAVLVLFTLSCFAGYGMYSRGSSSRGGGMQDYPVAEVDGQKVMRSEIEKSMGQIAEQYAQSGQATKVTSADFPALRQMALDNYVVTLEIRNETKSRGLKATDQELDEALKGVEDQFPTKEAFMQYLQRSGVTKEQMKERIAEEIVQKKLFEDVLKPASVDAKEARKFYDSMKDFFYRRPAGYTFNMMAFRSQDQAKQARALLQGGEKWDAVVVRFSKNISNATSYDQPVFVGEKDLADDLSNLKTLPIGKASNPVRITSDDVMVVVKRSAEKERVMSWNEVSGDVTNLLLSQKKKELQNKFFGELRGRAKVKVLDASIFPAPTRVPKAEPLSGEAKSGDQ